MANYSKGYNNQNKGYSNNNQNKQKVKHSGAKATTYTPTSGPNQGVEQHLTTGWRLSKGELIAIKCVTTSKSNLSDKGWFGSVACTFTNTKTGVQSFHWGTMQKNGGKVVIDGMAFVINPRAKNGGYAGTFLRSN
ncbi:hypothetical protein ACHRV5_00380 [Flavobacterium sp. FlaQc-52]|jgi:hypothetical protein|uniref:hypothetical protein n=1 Tax=Flavobacterium sp. FlaQc-52 TaxID=3374185 RepID=UPI003757B5DE